MRLLSSKNRHRSSLRFSTRSLLCSLLLGFACFSFSWVTPQPGKSQHQTSQPHASQNNWKHALQNNKSITHAFYFTARPIPNAIAKQMIGRSYHASCPLALDDLRYVSMDYWGFDHTTHRGHMIIHKQLVTDIKEIFSNLYRHQFPIEQMKIYSTFRGEGYAKANDSVGYYCAAGDHSAHGFSKHSYGMAVDLNPQQNPLIKDHKRWPPCSGKCTSAREKSSAMITTKSIAFKAFTRHGWIWGGFSVSDKDDMHFAKLVDPRHMHHLKQKSNAIRVVVVQ